MLVSVQTGRMVRQLGIDKTFETVKNAGFDAVDYNVDVYYKWDDIINVREVYPFNSQEEFDGYIDEVKAASEKYGIKIGQMHAPFPSFVKMSDGGTDMVQKSIRMCIEGCARLGCSRLVVHPCFDGSARYPMPQEREEAENDKLYIPMIPLLKKYHVICCLENMWKEDFETKHIYTGCCSDVNDAIHYIDKYNAMAGEKCFGFCLDTGHLLLLGLDFYDFVKKLGDRLTVLHVHDNNGNSDGHTAPYKGVANWERFIKALHDFDYKGNMNFETDGFLNRYPEELYGSALQLICSTGRYFVSRLENYKTE